ncbi:hypothetical protein PsorP6_010578 [Peronosclerospora sorghi]|uniref:Uncharacterized protein n=1 Tax=Peronosclerospora sorghi TaxID=230839 RepID=A0ACC0VWY4_9STRA|nr:hypothetical protein PsorP6_010578 [Peronosclerospora sorghi]
MIDLMLKSFPHHSVFLSFKSVLKFGSDRSNLDPTDVRHRMLLAAQEVAEIQGQAGRVQATGGKGKAKGDDKRAKDSGNGGEAGARRCLKCKSNGHIKANCPKIKKPSAGEGSGGAITKETNVFCSGGYQSTHASGSGVAKVTDGGPMNGQFNNQQPLGSTEHLSVGCPRITGNRDYFVTFEEFAESYEVTASGVFHDVRGRVEGIGTVALVTEVNGKRVRFYVDEVLYLPGARYSLLSSGHVEDQGFEYEYDRPHRRYRMMKDGEVLLNAKKFGRSYRFYSYPVGTIPPYAPPRADDVIVSFTTTDGVARLKVWHKRLAHTCTQYVKLMADRGMVDGMLVTKREHTACDACHLGKQRASRHRKKLDRTVSAPNQIVYADLMIPSKLNETRFSAVLMIMDAYSRFLTVHLLTSKKESVVNALMKQYVLGTPRWTGNPTDCAA